jgi:5-methylcytosine-specific restriction endonuclease McrA
MRNSCTECAYCGAVAKLTIDHVLPQLAGGSDDPTNIAFVCEPCNSLKGNMVLLPKHILEGAKLSQDHRGRYRPQRGVIKFIAAQLRYIRAQNEKKEKEKRSPQ